MSDRDCVRHFADLFEGRRGVYGAEEGGCLRGPTWSGSDGEVRMTWLDIVIQHLEGTGGPYGVYPMVPQWIGEPKQAEWHVRWGCVDLDVKRPGKNRWDYETEDDAHIAACNLHDVLATLGIPSWVEVTRSRGRHVWVLPRTWIEAATMRRALLVACQVADVPPTEVNPKQETLPPDAIGNYVRLPYPHGLEGHIGDRYMIGPDWSPWTLREFVEVACSYTPDTIAYKIKDAAALFKAPEPNIVPAPRFNEVTYTSGEPPHRDDLNGFAYTIWRDGPVDGDRSSTLFKLACQCRESGLPIDQAYEVVYTGDTRWGKFEGRHDKPQRIADVCAAAYR